MDYLRFIKYKWLYFAISLVIVLPGAFSLVRYGLRLSIDFTGGSLLEIQTRQVVDTQKITDLAAANGFHNSFYLDNPPDAEAYWINANGDELKEESELSLVEVAELIGVSFETVKSRMRYALDKLRSCVGLA